LQHRVAIFPEAEYNKRLPEHRVLRVKGENPQNHIRPFSLSRQALKLLIHYRIITNPTLQDGLIEYYR
jgi:hypothetical protein